MKGAPLSSTLCSRKLFEDILTNLVGVTETGTFGKPSSWKSCAVAELNFTQAFFTMKGAFDLIFTFEVGGRFEGLLMADL